MSYKIFMKKVDIGVGDKVILKKAHPCGANEWEVYKIGMDIWLSCSGCGHKVRLERPQFNRRFKSYISRAAE